MSKQIRNRRDSRSARRTLALRRALSRGAGLEKLEGRTLFSTFSVTTIGDSGPGSLRQAILNANATGTGAHLISFNLDSSLQSGGLWTIALNSPLPAVTASVKIDATTQNGYTGVPLVELRGVSTGTYANGFNLQGPAEQISGFVINGFGGAGVFVEATAAGAVISKNFIGTNATGSFGIANGQGIVTFGAYSTVSGNVISGNTDAGVRIRAEFARVQGNFIGTDASGAFSVPNLAGVFVTAGHALIGGSSAGRNVISGNIDDGILFNAAMSGGSFVQGNFIGTDFSGTHQLGNGGNGVNVQSSANVQIGGALAGQGNLISANYTNGLQISDSSGVVVAGNLIGTDVTGTIGVDPAASVFSSSLGNFGNGIYVSDTSTANVIGWTTADGRNVISNNQGDGVRIETFGTGLTTIEGNFIGTDSSGTVALGNFGNGVTVLMGATLIGGTNAAAGNVISGNIQSGIGLGDGNEDQNGATVKGNLIGLAADGLNALGNIGDGISIWGSDNVISGNVLAHNGANGVGIYNNEYSVTSGTGNSVRGNAIFANAMLGIDLGGDGATPNDSLDHIGPNNYQNFPLFTMLKNIAGNVTVAGTVGAAADTTFIVDLYGNTAANGQAEIFLGTVTVTTNSNGLATFSLALGALPDGVLFVTATATDPTGNTSELSASAAVPAPVFPVQTTTTTLNSSANPSIIGQNVTLTATVITANASAVVGMVTFKEGATVLGTAMVDSTGKATLTLASLSLGGHDVVAVFTASDNEAQLNSLSAPLSQQVQLAATETTLSASLPSATLGQSITLTSTVTSIFGTPTGTVTFMEGGTVLGSGTLDANGVATISLSTLALGSHTITAIYGGSATFETSASSPLVLHITSIPVAMVQSNTTLSSSINPAIVGQLITLTANAGPINGDLPTGLVTFMEGSTVLGTATLDSTGKAMLQLALGAGSYSITAVYGGDAKFIGSASDPLAQQVNLAATGTTLSSSINPATAGQTIIFTAKTTSAWAGTPTGTMKFWEGSTLLGTVAIDATGKATLSIASFGVGTHNVFATYSGDGTYETSTSTTLAQQVKAAVTCTTISSSANPSLLGQAITLTSIVSTTAGFVPGGSVKFMEGTTVLGSAALDASGKAALVISSLPIGTHSITAVYSGDANSLTSTSTPLAQNVNPVPATIGGHVFRDLAGDGLTPDDVPQSGVTIQLYIDKNGNGKLEPADTLLSTKVTGADGAFSFTGLAAGKYLVNEIAPAGTVRTAPALSSFYFNVVASGTNITNDDFANFVKEDCGSNIKNVKFTLTDKYGKVTTVTDLRGRTDNGETVKVTFTQTGTSADVFSLVTYTAPDAAFNGNTAYQQVVYQSQTIETHGQGTYTMTVKIPATGHYQVDFVCGNVIYNFGPAGSNIFYTPEGRLISADNG